MPRLAVRLPFSQPPLLNSLKGLERRKREGGREEQGGGGGGVALILSAFAIRCNDSEILNLERKLQFNRFPTHQRLEDTCKERRKRERASKKIQKEGKRRAGACDPNKG